MTGRALEPMTSIAGSLPRVPALEHFRAKLNHLTGMILPQGEARVARRCGASAKMGNDALGLKHPAYGGAHRLPGCVAALARYTASRFGPRLPWKPMSTHQIDSIWLGSALVSAAIDGPACEDILERPAQRRIHVGHGGFEAERVKRGHAEIRYAAGDDAVIV